MLLRQFSCLVFLCLGAICAVGGSFVDQAVACPDIDGLLDTNCDRKLVIITFGDSITAGRRDATGLGYPGRMRQLLPDAEILNFGVPGESTPDGRRRAIYQIPSRREADFVIILEGVNDFYLTEKSPRTTRNNLLAIRNTANNIGAYPLLGKLTATTRTIQRTWVRDVILRSHRGLKSISFLWARGSSLMTSYIRCLLVINRWLSLW